jgi:hypothetical protein
VTAFGTVGGEPLAAEMIALDVDVGELVEAGCPPGSSRSSRSSCRPGPARPPASPGDRTGFSVCALTNSSSGGGSSPRPAARHASHNPRPAPRAAVRPADPARVGIGEDRLDPRRDIAGQQGGRAGRRDRRQAAVAKPVLGDQRARLLVEALQVGRLQHASRHRAGTGPSRQRAGGGPIGFALDARQPAPGQLDGFAASVDGSAEQQGIGKAGDAQADATLGLRLRLLLGQRIARDVDDIVEHPHRGSVSSASCSSSIAASASNGRATSRARLIDPSRQAP